MAALLADSAKLALLRPRAAAQRPVVAATRVVKAGNVRRCNMQRVNAAAATPSAAPSAAQPSRAQVCFVRKAAKRSRRRFVVLQQQFVHI